MRAVQIHLYALGREQAFAEVAAHVQEERLVPIGELLTSSFVRRHTCFENLEAWLEAAGLSPAALNDHAPHALDSWNAFIRLSTRFPDWATMLREAGAEWVIRRLGIIIDA